MTDGAPARGVTSASLALAVVAFGLLAWALHGATVGRRLDDFDGAWHLACGRLLVETGKVPRQDPFCFTSDGLDWINLNWLAQVALYRAFLWRGFEGAQALAALGLTVALAGVALALRARGARPLLAVLALAPLWPTLVAVHSIRPQTFTFALFALAVAVLERPDPELRLGWRRALALTLGLLLWSHLHGGFVFGFALLGLDAAGSCLDARRRGLGWLPPRARWLAGVCAVGVLGFAAHPHGFAALAYGVTYTRALGRQLETVPELMPLDLAGPLGKVVLAWAAAAVVGLAAAGERPRARDVLVFGFFLLLTLKVRRASIPLVIATLPAVTAAWSTALARLAARAPGLLRLDDLAGPTARAAPAVLPLLAALWLGWTQAVGFQGAPGRVAEKQFDPNQTPVRAVQALQALRGTNDPRAHGRVFSLYSAGGLLVWALYPERRTFIDGRGDLHARGTAYDEYLEIAGLEPGWKERLDAWGVDLVLLGTGAPQVGPLAHEHGWRRVYGDGRWVLLARP